MCALASSFNFGWKFRLEKATYLRSTSLGKIWYLPLTLTAFLFAAASLEGWGMVPSLTSNSLFPLDRFWMMCLAIFSSLDSSDSVAITARSLEALSRLAEASARIRLVDIATVEDAQRAVRLTETWRHELMGENFDLTTIESGKKGKVRNQEKIVIDIVSTLQNQSGNNAQLLDVLTEAERQDISRSKAEDIIDKLCRDGRMMRPSGYDTLQVV
jgi:hypothetical protein